MKGDHCECIASHVDDLLFWTRDENAILEELKADFHLKNVGLPDHCLGGNVDHMTKHWTKENVGLGFSGKTHIENLIPKFETLFNTSFKPMKTPVATECHPEVDDTPFLSNEDAAKCRSVIGSLNWLITLGRFDVHCATNALGRFAVILSSLAVPAWLSTHGRYSALSRVSVDDFVGFAVLPVAESVLLGRLVSCEQYM